MPKKYKVASVQVDLPIEINMNGGQTSADFNIGAAIEEETREGNWALSIS